MVYSGIARMWEYSLECGSFPFLVPADLVLSAIMLYNFIIIIEDSDFSFKLKIDGQKKKKWENAPCRNS